MAKFIQIIRIIIFQNKHSTEHAIMNLVDDISCAFNKGEFTLGIFIDLSKASAQSIRYGRSRNFIAKT